VSDPAPSRQRLAVVAGAGGELGRAITRKLVDTGVSVVGVDRNEERLTGIADGVAREVADLSDPGAAGPLMERIVHEVGAPDVLINTIGAFRPGGVLTTTPDLLRQMLDVNLGVAVWVSQAVAPYMQRRGSGSIVHIASRPGIEPSAGMAAYSVSKAALVHLTRVLDVELRPLGIRVNSVAPQLLDTAWARSNLPHEALARAVAPDAIAEVVVFLASEAASPISGAVLPAYGP
jgi:NAD(P)-dependent dehydrogenase (short-subunit alcohol dehydrogenase family)